MDPDERKQLKREANELRATIKYLRKREGQLEADVLVYRRTAEDLAGELTTAQARVQELEARLPPAPEFTVDRRGPFWARLWNRGGAR